MFDSTTKLVNEGDSVFQDAPVRSSNGSHPETVNGSTQVTPDRTRRQLLRLGRLTRRFRFVAVFALLALVLWPESIQSHDLLLAPIPVLAGVWYLAQALGRRLGLVPGNLRRPEWLPIIFETLALTALLTYLAVQHD